jgi:SnoaL-like domain
MTNDTRAIWDTYAQAWAEPTAEAKAAKLSASVAANCVYRAPGVELSGHGALVEHMLDFHRQLPGGHFETHYFLAHHDRSIARWNMRGADGALLGEGISYGEYDAHGKLVAMTGFFATPQ